MYGGNSFYKEFKEEYPLEELEIIGLSADIDLKPLKAAIIKHELVWPQYYDRQKYMSNLYSVNTYPTMILINKVGRVIYRTGNNASDESALPSILKTLK